MAMVPAPELGVWAIPVRGAKEAAAEEEEFMLFPVGV
jgi:hypothetical protein